MDQLLGKEDLKEVCTYHVYVNDRYTYIIYIYMIYTCILYCAHSKQNLKLSFVEEFHRTGS